MKMSENPIMQFFSYAHLPEKLQAVSKPIGDLAKLMEDNLPNSAEKSVGLRKLLEAKDAFVRAALSAPVPARTEEPLHMQAVGIGTNQHYEGVFDDETETDRDIRLHLARSMLTLKARSWEEMQEMVRAFNTGSYEQRALYYMLCAYKNTK